MDPYHLQLTPQPEHRDKNWIGHKLRFEMERHVNLKQEGKLNFEGGVCHVGPLLFFISHSL